jgi:hypothetical protein
VSLGKDVEYKQHYALYVPPAAYHPCGRGLFRLFSTFFHCQYLENEEERERRRRGRNEKEYEWTPKSNAGNNHNITSVLPPLPCRFKQRLQDMIKQTLLHYKIDLQCEILT